MENLNCFLCNQKIPGGLHGLSKHLRHQHLLNLTDKLDTGFVCAQNGCPRNFAEFYLLRRHIRTSHLNVGETSDNLQASVEESFDMELEVNNYVEMQLDEAEVGNQEQNEMHNSEAEIEEENTSATDFAIRLVTTFQSHTSMSDTMLENVVQEFEEFYDYCFSSLKRKVNAQVQLGLVVDDNVINNINYIFEEDNPFRHIKTFEERIEVLKKNSGYIEPEEIELGKRIDSKFDKKIGGYVPVLVSETVLELILSSTEVRTAILSEHSSTDGILQAVYRCRIL